MANRSPWWIQFYVSNARGTGESWHHVIAQDPEQTAQPSGVPLGSFYKKHVLVQLLGGLGFIMRKLEGDDWLTTDRETRVPATLLSTFRDLRAEPKDDNLFGLEELDMLSKKFMLYYAAAGRPILQPVITTI